MSGFMFFSRRLMFLLQRMMVLRQGSSSSRFGFRLGDPHERPLNRLTSRRRPAGSLPTREWRSRTTPQRVLEIGVENTPQAQARSEVYYVPRAKKMECLIPHSKREIKYASPTDRIPGGGGTSNCFFFFFFLFFSVILFFLHG